MKKISFKIKFDEEFEDYYFIPFKSGEYVWINEIMKSTKGLIALTEYGYIPVKKIDWKNMKVICEL